MTRKGAPPSCTVQKILATKPAPFCNRFVLVPSSDSEAQEHSPGSLCCRTFLVRNGNQSNIQCWESMVLRDLQGMSRYICQNLPHTGASNITLYTTFINHWVVSPLWDMVGVHELQQMCFEFNSKTIQSHLSSLNKNAAKLKKTQEACRICPQPLSFTKKNSSFQGKKTYRKSKKKHHPSTAKLRSMIMVLKSAMQLAALISSKKTKTST